MKEAAILIFAYFLGGVPFGVIVGKLWKGIDIRSVGSGNIGATNAYRALGPGPAAVVFILDVAKGLVPVLLARNLFSDNSGIIVVTGLLAILGHTFSIFLKFEGGKGVATTLGVIFGLYPVTGAIAFGLWLVVLGLTRYVSIASMMGAVSIPISLLAFHQPRKYGVFGIIVAAFVIYKHRPNISRLRQGKEPRVGEKPRIGGEVGNDEGS
jgi:acyl phosphate:glycerol-3-phosphate acyltransferase